MLKYCKGSGLCGIESVTVVRKLQFDKRLPTIRLFWENDWVYRPQSDSFFQMINTSHYDNHSQDFDLLAWSPFFLHKMKNLSEPLMKDGGRQCSSFLMVIFLEDYLEMICNILFWQKLIAKVENFIYQTLLSHEKIKQPFSWSLKTIKCKIFLALVQFYNFMNSCLLTSFDNNEFWFIIIFIVKPYLICLLLYYR